MFDINSCHVIGHVINLYQKHNKSNIGNRIDKSYGQGCRNFIFGVEVRVQYVPALVTSDRI